MSSYLAASLAWRPEKRFWMTHAVLPLLAAAAILTLLEHTPVDLWLADWWYELEGRHWAWRDHWLAYDVIHHWGKQVLIAFGLTLLVLLALSGRLPRLRPWRTPMAYVLTSMALVPSVLAWFKRYSGVPCPWDLARYGGELAYRHNLDYSFGAVSSGHCFPAGHAAGGFGLLALYFAALLYAKRPALFLVPGLAVGFVFAFGQQARGAHFISHDLWTLTWCWFGSLLLFLAFRPQRWSAPRSHGDRAGREVERRGA